MCLCHIIFSNLFSFLGKRVTVAKKFRGNNYNVILLSISKAGPFMIAFPLPVILIYLF
jgi:hypothetical protein